jgi:PhoH-like ATPase
MKKTYCLDTSVVVHDPRAIYAFDDNVVVLTEYVLMELDKLKQGDAERNHSAREASRILREVTQGLSDKIIAEQKERPCETRLKTLPEIPIPGTKGGSLVLLMDDPEHRIPGPNTDDQILGLLCRNRGSLQTPIIVVTKDTLMAVKAIARGLGQQDYKRDQAKVEVTRLPTLDSGLFPVDDLFSGNGGVVVKDILKKTYKNGTGNRPIIPGYYLTSYDSGKELLLNISHEEKVRLISQTPNLCRSKHSRGVRAKNLEQHAAVDALLNPNKTLVCLVGPAGTGKTLLAIATALDMARKANRVGLPDDEREQEVLSRKERKQLRHQQQQENSLIERMQILIARPTVSMGKEMGYLPGDIEEKMRPWIQPILDNLKLLVGGKQADIALNDGTIELQPLQYIRGRSISNAILIIDEAQNTTPLEIKTIITRAGRDCRVILTGDPYQIDVPYLDKLSNGLSFAADRLGQEEFAAVIPLTKGERSRMATRATELL